MSRSERPKGSRYPPRLVGCDADELTDLLLAARDGDRAALAAVIRSMQPEVWRMASHLVAPDEADDVTQEVFLRVWRALPGFRGDSSARTWLLTIARRTCVDAVRARARWRRLVARVGPVAASEVRSGPDAAIALGDLVARLGVDARAAFVLTQVVGCSYEEAAAICDVPVGTIRSRVARARADLVEQVRFDGSMETG
jgi:RNA polymerase sigma-70 factor, ECF subfamily